MAKRIVSFINKHIEEYLLTVLLIGITVVMLLQVVMRYSFNAALSWPEEFCRYCFVYFSFLTVGYCVKNDTMLRLDVIKKLLPPAAWTVLSTIIQFISLAFYIYFLIYSIELVTLVKSTSRTSPAMGIPFYLIYIAAVVGFALASVRSIQSLFNNLIFKSNIK